MADDGKRAENTRDPEVEQPAVPATDEVKEVKEAKIEGPGVTPAVLQPEAQASNEAVATAPVPEKPEIKAEVTPPEIAPITPPAGEKKEEAKIESAPDIAPIMQTEKTPDTVAADAAKSAVNPQPFKPADMDAEAPPSEETDYKSSPDYSAFLANFRAKNLPVLNDMWGVPDVNDEFKEAIGNSGSIKKSKYGLDFNLPNGHKIEWHAQLGGSEFIGMSRQTDKFDADDAHATVAASIARGWQAINVHGTVAQKEMLWLEAQRQGIEVTNFQPTMDSDVRRQWEQEAMERAQRRSDKEVVGISDHPMNPTQKELDEARAAGDAPAQEETATPPENKDAAKPEPEKKEVAQPAAADADAESTPASKSSFIGPKTGEKAAPEAEAELPAGSITFEQFLKREMNDAKNSGEVSRGYMEIQSAIVEGKLDPADIDAIQLGRSEGMGGNAMREKMDASLTNNEFNKLADGIEGLMQKKGFEGFKISNRPALDEEPSAPAAKIEVVSETSGPKKSAPVMKA